MLASIDDLLDTLGLGLGRPRSIVRQLFGWFVATVGVGAIALASGLLGGPDLTSLPFAIAGASLFVEIPYRGFNERLLGPAIGLALVVVLFAVLL